MRRLLAATVQAFILLSSSLFIGWQYLAWTTALDSAQDVDSDLKLDATHKEKIDSNRTTSIKGSIETLKTMTTAHLTTSQTQNARQTSSVDGGRVLTSPSNAAHSMTEGLPRPPYLESSPIATANISSEETEKVSKYVDAIMNPQNTAFPRLVCETSDRDRYIYLQVARTYGTTRSKTKYFFALDLHECVGILPRLLGSIVEVIHFLGPEYCALSIVEGRSTDGTLQVLEHLKSSVTRMGTKYFLTTNTTNPTAGKGADRIASLAGLRNQALRPLIENSQDYDSDATVVFINDVSICMEDILELIHQRYYQLADMTCAMDWIYGGSCFYDVWVSRGMNGDQFFEIPQSGTWDFADNLFWNDLTTKARLLAQRPFQVFACWNGATAFRSRLLLPPHNIHFRTSKHGECYMGEPTLLCKDMWYAGFNRIAVIPSINIGYGDEESAKVKTRHGSLKTWFEQEQQREDDGSIDEMPPMLIDWDRRPPELIKCVPTYQNPSWVAWNQGLLPKGADAVKAQEA